MIFDLQEQRDILKKHNICISYSGPMWEDGVKGLAEVVKTSLSYEDLPGKIAKTIFSVFIEQVTNMLMYSVEKESYESKKREQIPVGSLVLGRKGKTYFIQTGNVIKNENVDFIKSKIDHLNTLDKAELRQLQKITLREGDDNPESKGAGLGLIEVARRATSPIEFSFDPVNNNVSFFSMYVEIGQEDNE